MNETEIELRILLYLDDGFEDTGYITTIVNSLTFSHLAALICRLLKSQPEFEVTSLFLRDAIVCGYRNDACQQFRDDYLGSIIVSTLEELVFTNNHFIRSNAIYTLGKTCSYTSKNVLVEAFDRFIDTDPLLLNRLIHEMGWLGVENMENYLERMATNTSYLTRWAAVEFIYQSTERLPNWAELLRQDSCELIRLEAEYECQRILKSFQTSSLSKIQQRQRAKEIVQIEPKISFQQLSLQFTRDLYVRGQSEYSVVELEAFIDERKSPSPCLVLSHTNGRFPPGLCEPLNPSSLGRGRMVSYKEIKMHKP
ncbi:hypothetical protein [Chamaesiphon sp. GL140_3_metabinner_50]|uniref:HEAT repeat domain-containing protein n=1 Tax=Chamaesiphon sp. GL140_3_metabinner_50 TaxID=2970812 RepID=UPI0025F0AD09|nr:hypothetical protein [Chamaesiphon sp. GL140_3_metabinner_50]